MTNILLRRASDQVEVENFDLVILGSGTAGTYAACAYGKKGRRVAMIERKCDGISCSNLACLASKNVIHSAKVASYVRRAGEYGICVSDFRIDMPRVRKRQRDMVAGLYDEHREGCETSGVELMVGVGRFIGPRVLEVALEDGSVRRVQGRDVIVDIGARAAVPPVPGLVQAQPLSYTQALELDVIPEHLMVVGGGYVGLEVSQAFRRLGSRVSVIERHDRLAHDEDEDVSEALRNLFDDEGIDVLLNSRVTQVSGRSGEAVRVVVERNGVGRTLAGSHLLVAAGRIPNIEDISLAVAGVRLTDRGFVRVNERLQTTAPGVWAVGEVTGSPQSTHVSVEDFRVILGNIEGGKRVTTGRLVPSCLFTDPELARVGLSEREARAKDISYRVFRSPAAQATLRAHTLSETRGFLKALVETTSDRIIGFTAFGVGAGEIVSAVQIAMIARLPYTELSDAIIAHPTLAEGIGSLFASTPLEISIKSEDWSSLA